MALTNLNPNPITAEQKSFQYQLESVSKIQKSSVTAIGGKSPIAVAVWVSAFVALNNTLLNILVSQGILSGSESLIASVTLVTEVGLAAFALIVISGALIKGIVSDLKSMNIGLDLPLFLANMVLSVATVWLGFAAPEEISARGWAYNFAWFSLLFSSAVLLKSKGSGIFRSAAPATLGDIAPTARVVRPMDKFEVPSNVDNQGVLFPPEEAVIVPSISLREGDLVRVSAGEIAPCDGVVTEGAAIVEERKYLGNTHLRSKERGQEIFGGSKIIEGSLDIKIGLTQSESIGAAFDAEIVNANTIKFVSPETRYLLSFGNLTLVFVAILGGVIAAYETQSLDRVAIIMASVLSLSLIAIPLDLMGAIKSAILSKAFVKGVLIKGAHTLDKMIAPRVPVFGEDPLNIFREPKATMLDIMDSRIDRKSLGGVILGLSLRGENPIFREVVRLLTQREKLVASNMKIEDFREYDARGVTGVVSGAEITIGFEDFLIDRGVFLQSSDLAAQGGHYALFVAIGEDVVARVIFESPAIEFKAQGIDPLKMRSVRSVLTGYLAQNLLDVQGQRLGFELSSIFGGLDEKGRAEKINSLGDVYLYGSEALSKVNGDGGLPNAITVSLFDERGASGAEGDVVIFNRGPEILSVLNTLGEKLRWASLESKIFMGICGMGLLVSVVAGVFSPLVPAGLAILSVGYAYLWPNRMASVFGHSQKR
jgi:cation transport ATPase